MEEYLHNFKDCLQKEIPFCQDTCPFGYDVFDFIEKIKAGNFNAAYKTFRNGVGFPAIVSSLCEETCKSSCPLGCSINLKKLERASVELATRKTPTDYNLPLRKQKIAIVGGGLSGLGCLLKLATKKYQVDLFEKTSSLGGTAMQHCSPEVVQEDISLQLVHEKYNLYLEREIKSIEELSEYDAIYVATGALGSTFGFEPNLSEEDLSHPKYLGENSTISFEWNGTGVFFGGQLLGLNEINALAMGLSFGVSIDNFLRTGNLNYGDGKKKTNIQIEESLIHSIEEVSMDLPFTKETAIEEASRCIKCQCNPCQLYCDLTSFSKKWPLRIRDEVQATTLPGTSEVKATPAKRLINTCTQCGLCKDTCPKDIDMGGLILEGRKSMHRQEKMPWVFKEFWLKDMGFSNGDSSLIKAPLGINSPELLFFPGCQLSAGEPTLVEKSYEYLLDKNPSTGLFLGCCGLPALWSGDEDLTLDTVNYIKKHWLTLGKPTFVVACPSCHKFFQEQLPEIQLKYIYEFIDVKDFNNLEAAASNKNKFIPSSNSEKEAMETLDGEAKTDSKDKNQISYTVFDPCTTRADSPIRETIRKILQGSGIKTQANNYHESFTGCCGYGGQSEIADPSFVEHVKNRRLNESDLPFICYCINCRDSFKEDRPSSIHILDLLFSNNPSNPDITQRRLNRLKLKEKLLINYWEEIMEKKVHKLEDMVVISPSLEKTLSDSKMLKEEVLEVIDFCEKTKRVIYDEDSKTFSGYKKVGNATYWVEYMKEEAKIILINAYTHRISIELEEVWNGEKRKNEEML